MHRSLRIACALGVLALLSGCFHGFAPHHGRHGGHVPLAILAAGPPPHAPAHGHRHRHEHEGVELVFDSALGVYAVVGWANHFFHDGHFYRQGAAGWELSVRIDRGWGVAEHSRLPKRLAKHGHRKHHKKRKHHPAKQRH